MGRVDDRRVRSEAAGVGEQLDRTEAVLREAFLDLAGLLVGMDVQRQALRICVPAEPPGCCRYSITTPPTSLRWPA